MKRENWIKYKIDIIWCISIYIYLKEQKQKSNVLLCLWMSPTFTLYPYNKWLYVYNIYKPKYEESYIKSVLWRCMTFTSELEARNEMQSQWVTYVFSHTT